MFGKKGPTSSDKYAIVPMEKDDGSLEIPPDPLKSGDDSLYTPTQSRTRKAVEQLLLERGQINEEHLTQAKTVQAQTPGKSITQILLTMNAATEAQILSALAEVHNVPFLVPEKKDIDAEAFAMLSPDYIRKTGALPIRFEDKVLVVAVTDPTNIFLLDEVKRKVKRELKIVCCTMAEINKIVEHMTNGNADQVDDIIKDMKEEDLQVIKDAADNVADLEKAGSDAPVIRFVNYVIHDAIKQGASDIHIEPKEKALKVRYRIDGILFESMNPPHAMAPAIVSRLKIMANLDIAERRLPQDGRVRAIMHGRKIDLRMSTLPTANGEKVVLRILDNRSISVKLTDLGFSENHLTIWAGQIDQPHGILLVTGPTGSGKTTTLYASLGQLDGNKLNISTVEDPIEYHLGVANQVQVFDKIGMTFSAALRALLRQDPDVVMLGEIRDPETARIAVQASLTGHLVLSTLHTNDAPSSITRLINIGVEPYLISAALNAILAQRLVRKICTQCKEPFKPTDDMREFLTLQGFDGDQTFKGKGCDKCRKSGYSGRLGIHELLVMDDSLRDMITRNPDVTHLRKLCRERGLVSLRQDGFAKVMAGLTTVDEILRVTESST
ncbi:MAG TPA: ATPase, T2SS/T4P/T4SS family [Tepidisphaeraceae bacterium]|nr:ATPase, T2SS/T4P/T4SS family [Tepidisphaeraceae bacterium]